MELELKRSTRNYHIPMKKLTDTIVGLGFGHNYVLRVMGDGSLQLNDLEEFAILVATAAGSVAPGNTIEITETARYISIMNNGNLLIAHVIPDSPPYEVPSGPLRVVCSRGDDTNSFRAQITNVDGCFVYMDMLE